MLDVSAEAKDFIKKILVVNPAKRMTAEEALQHAWITSGAKKSLKRLETFNVNKFKEYTQVKFKSSKKSFFFIHLFFFLSFSSRNTKQATKSKKRVTFVNPKSFCQRN